MNEKGKVIALSGFVFNEIFMMLIRMDTYIPEGPIPHSRPIIAGTAMLSLIPLGITFLFVSLVLEIIDRSRRTDTTENWDDT